MKHELEKYCALNKQHLWCLISSTLSHHFNFQIKFGLWSLNCCLKATTQKDLVNSFNSSIMSFLCLTTCTVCHSNQQFIAHCRLRLTSVTLLCLAPCMRLALIALACVKSLSYSKCFQSRKKCKWHSKVVSRTFIFMVELF